MSLIQRYERAIQLGDIHDDPQQRQLLMPLAQLSEALIVKKTWYPSVLKSKVKGLYLTGAVGVGKTYMLDLFFHELNSSRKLRMHFLTFMQQIDQKLRKLQGQSNPLNRIAQDLANDYQVLCIDEFMVQDIAYAMILGELLQGLFKRGVVLVATSNTPINDLYCGGQNRERFLPAITLLHRYCNEIALQSKVDYRLGKPVALQAYLYPINAATTELMMQQFKTLVIAPTFGESNVSNEPHISNPSSALRAPSPRFRGKGNNVGSSLREWQEGGEIVIQSRSIPVIRSSLSVIWFDFKVICNMPRCQLDYIELAEKYHTIFISGMPILSDLKSNTAVVLLIQLIDVLYDRGTRLIVSAMGPLAELYPSGALSKEFVRTHSRLEEMQSAEYLARHCEL